MQPLKPQEDYAHLVEENARLKDLLRRHGIDSGTPPEDQPERAAVTSSATQITHRSPEEDKITLFRSLFKGTGLYGKEWTGDAANLDPLTVALRNVAASEGIAEKHVGPDLISRFQYYRSVRNWVVHTKESNVSKPQAKFDEIVPYSVEHQQLFRLLHAPNPPPALCFDDFVLFSRLTKMIAEKLCRLTEPPMDHWVRNFPLVRFKRLVKNPSRMRNAVSGRLRTEYGMDLATANWIADELCGSLA